MSAVHYASLGLHVLPLVGKLPDGARAPHGVHSATVDAALAATYRGNVGIAIGVGSLTGVRVLDVDVRNGGDVQLAALELRHGPLPRTPRQRTGADGWHVLFSFPDTGDFRTKLLPGVELLGPGKYFVAAPSVHPDTGRAYAWTVEPSAPIAPAPAWLLQIACPPPVVRRRAAPVEIRTGDRYARGALKRAVAVVESAAKGERNNTLYSETFAVARFVVGGQLLESLATAALLDAATAAGLPEKEAGATIASALRGRARA